MVDIRPKVAVLVRRLQSDDETLTDVELSNLKPSLSVDEMVALSRAAERNRHIRRLALCKSLRENPVVAMILLRNVIPNHPSLQVLDLSGNNLNNEHAVAVGHALKSDNTKLRILNLSSNQIGVDGAKAIAEGLRTNRVVEQVSLSQNQIGNKGCEAIALAIQSNPHSAVTDLYLAANNIKDHGVIALMETLCCCPLPSSSSSQQQQTRAHHPTQQSQRQIPAPSSHHDVHEEYRQPKIMELHLNNNKLTDAGFVAITKALQRNSSLCELGLSVNHQISSTAIEGLVAALTHTNYALEALYLHGSNQFVTEETRQRIGRICDDNRFIKTTYTHLQSNIRVLSSPSLLPIVLEQISSKPNLIFQMLKSKPDWYEDTDLHDVNARRTRNKSTVSSFIRPFYFKRRHTAPASSSSSSSTSRRRRSPSPLASSSDHQQRGGGGGRRRRGTNNTARSTITRRNTATNNYYYDPITSNKKENEHSKLSRNIRLCCTTMFGEELSSKVFRICNHVWIRFNSYCTLSSGATIYKEILVILVLAACIATRVYLTTCLSSASQRQQQQQQRQQQVHMPPIEASTATGILSSSYARPTPDTTTGVVRHTSVTNTPPIYANTTISISSGGVFGKSLFLKNRDDSYRITPSLSSALQIASTFQASLLGSGNEEGPASSSSFLEVLGTDSISLGYLGIEALEFILSNKAIIQKHLYDNPNAQMERIMHDVVEQESTIVKAVNTHDTEQGSIISHELLSQGLTLAAFVIPFLVGGV